VARPKIPLLSRDMIAHGALMLMDLEGDGKFSMARLAALLGVTTPSLYNHVASKEAVIDLIRDVAFSPLAAITFAGSDWKDTLESWAFAYWNTLGAHPRSVPHLITKSPTHLDAVVGYLETLGWPRDHAARAVETVRSFVNGAALTLVPDSFTEDGKAVLPCDLFQYGLAICLEGLEHDYQRLQKELSNS